MVGRRDWLFVIICPLMAGGRFSLTRQARKMQQVSTPSEMKNW